MFKILKYFIVALTLVQVSFAEEEEKLFLEGNKFYKEAKYQQAIEVYENLVKDGYESASLYYNLGNAYYRTGKIGFAILNYEKALKLSPFDDDIEHNLLLANSQTVDRIEPLPKFFLFQWWEGLLATFSLSGWTYLTYLFYFIVLVSIGFYFFDKKYQKIYLYSAFISVIILVFTISILIAKVNRDVNTVNGVVVEPAVSVKQSPDSKSSDAFMIHEGLKVKLEDRVDEWVKIKLNDGKVGWLPKENLRVI